MRRHYWKHLSFFFYNHIGKDYSPIIKYYYGGTPENYNRDEGLDTLWGDHRMSWNPLGTVEMLLELIYAYGGNVIDEFHPEKRAEEIKYYLYCYNTVSNYNEINKSNNNNIEGLVTVEKYFAIRKDDIGKECRLDLLEEHENISPVTRRLYRETELFSMRLFGKGNNHNNQYYIF